MCNIAYTVIPDGKATCPMFASHIQSIIHRTLHPQANSSSVNQRRLTKPRCTIHDLIINEWIFGRGEQIIAVAKDHMLGSFEGR